MESRSVMGRRLVGGRFLSQSFRTPNRRCPDSGRLRGLRKPSHSGRSTCVPGVGGRMALVSLLALCAAASSQEVLAAPTPASSKSKKSRAARKAARKPPPPPAEIPKVEESASVWRGCLESEAVQNLAERLGMEPSRLAALLEEMGSSASPGGGCIPYVAATGGEAGVASVIFRQAEPGGESRTLALHKTPDGIVTTPGVCDCRESTRRVLSLPAGEFTASSNPAPASIPSNVLWQLDILVPRMMAGLRARRMTAAESARTTSDGGPQETLDGEPETQRAEVPIDNYIARVVVGRYGDDERERLESVEIVDQSSGRRLNGAWWLDRPDGPGVIIGKDGVAYERLLWESPVKYVRSSRGVGASVTTWRRRVPAKKGGDKS